MSHSNLSNNMSSTFYPVILNAQYDLRNLRLALSHLSSSYYESQRDIYMQNVTNIRKILNLDNLNEFVDKRKKTEVKVHKYSAIYTSQQEKDIRFSSPMVENFRKEEVLQFDYAEEKTYKVVKALNLCIKETVEVMSFFIFYDNKKEKIDSFFKTKLCSAIQDYLQKIFFQTIHPVRYIL
ncbi:hypothetical protein ACFW04_013633 [Cataglyphis niger]